MTAAREVSIVGRLTLIVGSGAALSVLANALLFSHQFEPLVGEMLRAQVRQVAAARAALSVVPSANRAAVARRLAMAGLHTTAVAPDPLQDSERPSVLERQLLALAGPGERLQVGRFAGAAGYPVLRSRFEVDGQPWWVTLPVPQPLASPLLPVMLALLCVGLAAALALMFGVRLVSEPLVALAAQLRARRGGLLQPIDEPLRATAELRPVIVSFNEMVQALQTAEARRREWLAGLSHDLRGPLTRLRLRAETGLPDTVAVPMALDFDVLDRMLRQFVAFAEVENTARLDGRRIALADCIDATVARYAGQPVTAEPVDPAAAAEPVPELSMVRLLSNLIDNALRHGRGAVSVSAARVGGGWQLLVWDQGTGIEAQQLRSALEPFVRLGQGPQARDSSGLGLSIVDQIVRRLGGQVILRPHDGHRSAVGVFWPAG